MTIASTGYSFEWRIEYRDKDGTGTSADHADPDKTRRTPLTTYWDNGFYIACASSACGGKSELGLNVAAPECTMVGKRIVVCALQAMPSSRSARQWLRPYRSLPAAPGIVASDCRTHGGSRFSLLKSAVAFLRLLHRSFSNIVDRWSPASRRQVPWGVRCSVRIGVAQGRMWV